MKDPYIVLGINRNATDEEVKSAYRELARKYHPDNYSDNTLSGLAAEKMKEINDAYDTIMNSRKSRGNDDSHNGAHNSRFSDVRDLIKKGRFEDAQEILDGIAPEKRDAEWYFLNGTVLNSRGWFDAAFTSFSTAYRMNPQNPEYRRAFERAQRTRGGFSAGGYRGNSYAGNGCNTCDMCSSLICADCCCEIFGGDLISCC